MASQTISQSQLHAINSGLLDFGEVRSNYSEPVKLTDITNTLVYLGGLYVDLITENINKSKAVSSGAGADSIFSSDVKYFGSVYTVEISMNKYLKWVDEGVDGWEKARGSKYKFKTKGVDPNGEMVKSVKAWILREGKMKRLKGKSIKASSLDQLAISTSYLIKRFGIKPKGFIKKSTAQLSRVVAEELGKALKVDIINNLT